MGRRNGRRNGMGRVTFQLFRGKQSKSNWFAEQAHAMANEARDGEKQSKSNWFVGHVTFKSF